MKNNKLKFFIILFSSLILINYLRVGAALHKLGSENIWFPAPILRLGCLKAAHGFIVNEIVAQVQDKPITLNDLYFLGNFRRILYKEPEDLNKNFTHSQLNKLLSIYINRLLILNDEHEINIISISGSKVNDYIKKFEKDFRIKYKNMKFNEFLSKFGYNHTLFFNFIKNLLIEKEFIVERLKLFLNISGENIGKMKLSGNNNIKKKKLNLDIKNWLKKLRTRSKIDIIMENY